MYADTKIFLYNKTGKWRMVVMQPTSYIYYPPLFIFGSARLTKIETLEKLVDDVKFVVKDVSDSIRQAYSINTEVNVVREPETIINIILSPVKVVLDQNCSDYHINKWDEGRFIRNLLFRQLRTQKESSVVLKDSFSKEVHYIHRLSSEFNTFETSNFLAYLQKGLFELAHVTIMSDVIPSEKRLELVTYVCEQEKAKLFL